jgi:hypothetical protein
MTKEQIQNRIQEINQQLAQLQQEGTKLVGALEYILSEEKDKAEQAKEVKAS